MKRVATSLLVLAAVIFLAARYLEVGDGEGGGEPWAGWGYIRATAEAAMVGALADWFAVTALFRHPLGLPIPHTAIVRRRKDQIGESLGGFVEVNFLTREVLGERLEAADLGRRLGDWLAEPDHARSVGDQSAAVVRGITEVLSDEVIQDGLESVVLNRARQVTIAPLVGRGIDVAIEGGHHEVLFDAVLNGIDGYLTDNLATFRNRLMQESPRWVPEVVDDIVFEKAYEVVTRYLGEVKGDRNHELRRSAADRMVTLAADLKTSPELIAKGEELKEEVLAHPEFRAWSDNLWRSMKDGLLEATENPRSGLRLRLEESLVAAGRALQDDPELRAKLDDWIIDGVGYVAEQFRGEVASLISSTVQRWDTEETSDRIELQVGRDLQFIRINGTVVGGLAGLAIYTVSKLLIG